MKPILIFAAALPNDPNYSTEYLAGGLIALLILVYLIYTLIKPEKF